VEARVSGSASWASRTMSSMTATLRRPAVATRPASVRVTEHHDRFGHDLDGHDAEHDAHSGTQRPVAPGCRRWREFGKHATGDVADCGQQRQQQRRGHRAAGRDRGRRGESGGAVIGTQIPMQGAGKPSP
jgi:hypothetical protein